MSAMIPKLEGLDSLARRDGVDIRPTLVRVLTDLYVQKPAHTSEEERHYTELVLRMIDGVDLPTRTAIANKLATYANAPPAIVRRLARDVIEVAEPVLRQSTVLTTSELDAIVRGFGTAHASAIAQRTEATRGEVRRQVIPVAPAPMSFSPIPPARDKNEITLADLFFSADSEARRTLLRSLGNPELEAPQGVRPEETIRALEEAALARDPARFAKVLEGALSLTAEQAARIVHDPSGEPLLVAAKAVAMPSVVLQRVLMFIDPAIGESVQRVFDLAGFYERLSTDAAHEVIASLRGRESVRARKPAQHRAALYDDEANRGRRGTGARRPIETRETSPARTDTGIRQRTR